MPELANVARYYTVLVDHVDHAIRALDEHNHIKARIFLVQGLQEAEEVYIGMTYDGSESDFSADGENPRRG